MDKTFYVCNGKTAENLDQLKSMLRGMTLSDYSYHANDERNDFAHWAEDSLGEVKVAQLLKKAVTPKEAIHAIEKGVAKDLDGTSKSVKKVAPTKSKHPRTTESVITDFISLSEHGNLMVKELVFGAMFGFILGLVVMTILINLGVF